MAKNIEKYDISLRIIHWLMAAIIIGLIAVGWYMADLSRESPLKGTLVGIHKSFGALILILFVVRVILRIKKGAPPLPETIRPMDRRFAALGHLLLYFFILIVPLSGYAMSNLYGYGVNLFGIPLPKIFFENKALGEIAHEAHEVLPCILLAIIAAHVVAVIKHRYFDKPGNDVLPRML